MSESIKPATMEGGERGLLESRIHSIETEPQERHSPVNTPPMMAQTPVKKCVNDLKNTTFSLFFTDRRHINPPTPPSIKLISGLNKDIRTKGISLGGNIPVFFCEFDHHGGQLVQHKDTGEALVSYQPVSNFFMSGDGKLVCFYHLEKDKWSETDSRRVLKKTQKREQTYGRMLLKMMVNLYYQTAEK